jgi:hypothetical protein
MNQMRTAIMELDSQRLPLQRNLGDAFAVVCRYFGHTAKPVTSAFGLDKKTAVNALDGKAGVPVITKALQARQKASDDHYELWLALGQMIFGETLDDWEERRLTRIIEANTHVIDTISARRQRREELRALASADAGGLARRRA